MTLNSCVLCSGWHSLQTVVVVCRNLWSHCWPNWSTKLHLITTRKRKIAKRYSRTSTTWFSSYFEGQWLTLPTTGSVLLPEWSIWKNVLAKGIIAPHPSKICWHSRTRHMTLSHITYNDITSMKFDGDTKPRNGIKLDEPEVESYWHLLLTITLTKRTPMKSIPDASVSSIQLKLI